MYFTIALLFIQTSFRKAQGACSRNVNGHTFIILQYYTSLNNMYLPPDNPARVIFPGTAHAGGATLLSPCEGVIMSGYTPPRREALDVPRAPFARSAVPRQLLARSRPTFSSQVALLGFQYSPGPFNIYSLSINIYIVAQLFATSACH